MLVYKSVLLLHIFGVIVLFIASSVEFLGFIQMRRARQAQEVRTITAVTRQVTLFHPISQLIVLATGLYMTATAWSFSSAWVDVALGVFVVCAVTGGAYIQRGLALISREARQAPDGALPESLRARLLAPALFTAMCALIALTLGLVYLMVFKPELPGALIGILVALLIGLAAASPVWRSPRVAVAQGAVSATSKTDA